MPWLMPVVASVAMVFLVASLASEWAARWLASRVQGRRFERTRHDD